MKNVESKNSKLSSDNNSNHNQIYTINTQRELRKSVKIITPFRLKESELILLDEVVKKLGLKSRRKAIMKLIFDFLKKDYE